MHILAGLLLYCRTADGIIVGTVHNPVDKLDGNKTSYNTARVLILRYLPIFGFLRLPSSQKHSL